MPSKYDRLADYLATVDSPVVTLTFEDVERIVGPLPATARRMAEWWGATPKGRYIYAHTLRWWKMGWVADRPDFPAETVTFRRVGRS